MNTFSKRSKERLETCHPRLIELMTRVLGIIDITIICGHRDEKAQAEAFASGVSRKKWPMSAHNKSPALAVDIAPYPIDWADKKRFTELAAVVKNCWSQLGGSDEFILVWGGDWETLADMPHWELRKK